MQLARHPLWLVGFRPFFSLACLAGMILPVAWALIFGGSLPAPDTAFTSLQWHAHEMFFGFGWAVLGGFLLTSTKNWVSIRGYHGAALAWLAVAWVVERIGMAFGGHWPAPLFLIANNLFLGSLVAMLMWTLIRHRAQDSYRDNVFFIVLLPAFLVAKHLLLSETHFAAGYGMALALFRLAFLVMLERTLTQFMKGVFQAQILRAPKLDMAIKLLALLLVVQFLLPTALATSIAALLAALLAIRFVFWKPQLGFRRIDIGVMYLGYLAITGQLLIEALSHFIEFHWVGAVSVHLFTFGAMGTVIPAMIIRISKGHTGRKVVFDGVDRLVLWIMILGTALRLVAPQLAPDSYLTWIRLAAACWFAGFGILGWRYIPILSQPRIDGREH